MFSSVRIAKHRFRITMFSIDCPAESFPYRRTGATSLTDDELILLDVLFEGYWVDPALLRQESFAPQWDTPEHTLSDDQLWPTLLRWTKSGILDFDSDSRIRITETGGSLWEAERQPNWDRYACYWWSEALPSGDRIAFILARNRQIAVHCYWWTVSAGHFRPVPAGRMHMLEIKRSHWLYWKKFSPWQLIAFPVQTPDFLSRLQMNWILLECRRSWWTTVRELQTFLD